MIINTGGRTDTVQYYSEWLLRRFAEGHVLSRNPMCPARVSRYDLSPEAVDCVIFCSKDYSPILPRLREITDRYNTYFFYTITAYGADIEPGVPPIERGIETLIELSRIVGARRLAWRYDPVLVYGQYTIERHMETFDRMTRAIAPHVDRCIFSFVELYKKVRSNMPDLMPVSDADMERIARGLGRIASSYRMPIQSCASGADWRRWGIGRSGCVTLETLAEANDVVFRAAPHRGMRPGCACIESRDIGAYDSCPNGCRYCYANRDPYIPRENFRLHDPASPLLIGALKPDDEIVQGAQRSLRI